MKCTIQQWILGTLRWHCSAKINLLYSLMVMAVLPHIFQPCNVCTVFFVCLMSEVGLVAIKYEYDHYDFVTCPKVNTEYNNYLQYKGSRHRRFVQIIIRYFVSNKSNYTAEREFGFLLQNHSMRLSSGVYYLQVWCECMYHCFFVILLHKLKTVLGRGRPILRMSVVKKWIFNFSLTIGNSSHYYG